MGCMQQRAPPGPRLCAEHRRRRAACARIQRARPAATSRLAAAAAAQSVTRTDRAWHCHVASARGAAAGLCALCNAATRRADPERAPLPALLRPEGNAPKRPRQYAGITRCPLCTAPSPAHSCPLLTVACALWCGAGNTPPTELELFHGTGSTPPHMIFNGQVCDLRRAPASMAFHGLPRPPTASHCLPRPSKAFHGPPRPSTSLTDRTEL